MCEAIATSKEHVPARCFFPKNKDVAKGQNYRNNLLTVPSCDKHNSGKSHDDEYLLLVIANHCQGNHIANIILSNPIRRAFEKNPRLLRLLKNPRLDYQRNSIAYIVDKERFDTSIGRIARALYFAESGRKWFKKLNITTPSLVPRVTQLSKQGQRPMVSDYEYELERMDGFVMNTFKSLPQKGQYPDIFSYQIHIGRNSLEEYNFIIRMIFYNDCRIVVFGN
jgi:hypothetical protein